MWHKPFTILFTVLAGFFLGLYIDNLLSLDVPVFAMIFSILGLISGIWSSIKNN